MFCITLALKNNPAPWTLLFKSEDTASTIWQSYNAWNDPNDPVLLADDFGQIASIAKSSVAGAMFEDLDKSMLAHIERGLHNARTQARAQQMARNDPILKTAAMSGAPAIFDPTMQNGMHRG